MGEKPPLTFGEELRRERLIREVSLEEISAATKISVRLLSALEASDISRLPAPVYSRGFIRAYARHLGLDPDEMVNAYLADVAPEKSREVEGARKGRLRSRFLRGRRAAGTMVVSVTAILLLLGLIARPERRPTTAAPVPRREIAPVSFKNVAVSPGPALVARGDSAPAMAADDLVPSPKAPTGVTMILEYEQDSWTEVSADGATIFSGVVRRGFRREFQAREGFRLSLGNAGGVRVTVDGRALEPLGQAGQVVKNLPLPADRQG